MSHKAWQNAHAMYENDACAKALGIDIISMDEGFAVVTMTVTAQMLNGHQSCHGGQLFSLADTAFAYACNSQGLAAVASACTIDFLRPGFAGDTLTATAQVRHQGKQTGVYDIEIVNQQQKTVALFRGKSPPHRRHHYRRSLMREAFICDGIRTPIGRYGGALSSVRADDLAAIPLRELLVRNPRLDAECIDDVILGCANQAGEDNRNVARMATLLAGLPQSVSGTTINRLCGSGLDALGFAARAIKAGDGDLLIAGGVESMSRAPFVMGKAASAFSRQAEMFDTTIGWRFVNPLMAQQFGTDSMPETAENVAELLKISREDQDSFALRSQQRTAKAQSSGILAEEIVPVVLKNKKGVVTEIQHDEHLRPETTLEQLRGLKAPFRANGVITAGNASGVNDGAAALIIASEQMAAAQGLTPRARIVAMATAGVEPRLMGLGPVPATRRVLERAGLSIHDMDVIELNEAFAAQALGVLRELGLPDDAPHVNPNGGAIALGHPLGMSGARLALAASHELHRRNGRYALCTMCIGVGQGIAMILERV
ncbi:beta-ketoadipyl CoA thiolase [Escherichia coli]|nr:beta-ketoadipyl CoA thiolase [Escherichia coli]